MPLTVNNKTESKSIEDLIAQLDAPQPQTSANTTADCDDQGERKIIRGKRTTSISNSENGGNSYNPVLNKNILISKKYSKVKGRGLAKKGGGGGNFTWGAPGCELNTDSVDKDDPNYDSEQDAGNYVMVCVENENASRTDSDGTSATVRQTSKMSLVSNNKQQLELDEFDKNIKSVILEYYQNGDSVEVIDYLNSYDLSNLKMRTQLLAFIIQLSLDHNSTSKELTSRLLRDFHVDLFTTSDFENGFNSLLNNLNELTLDNPVAFKLIGTFIARCIADKVLTKDFINNYNKPNANDDALNVKIQQSIDEAKILISLNDHLFHLAHIWGHNQGGFTAVKDLTDKINFLIQEFYDSGDIDEAIRCLKDLNVPHFNHEFIYEALDFILQKGDDYAIELITNLLKRLYDSVVVTYNQLKLGFTRIYDLLPDISLDVPNAFSLMDKVITVCQTKGIINADIADLGPNRSRKRFVSEGDGGRLKDENGH